MKIDSQTARAAFHRATCLNEFPNFRACAPNKSWGSYVKLNEGLSDSHTHMRGTLLVRKRVSAAFRFRVSLAKSVVFLVIANLLLGFVRPPLAMAGTIDCLNPARCNLTFYLHRDGQVVKVKNSPVMIPNGQNSHDLYISARSFAEDIARVPVEWDSKNLVAKFGRFDDVTGAAELQVHYRVEGDKLVSSAPMWAIWTRHRELHVSNPLAGQFTLPTRYVDPFQYRAVIIDGTTYIPARMAELFGYHVSFSFDKDNQNIAYIHFNSFAKGKAGYPMDPDELQASHLEKLQYTDYFWNADRQIFDIQIPALGHYLTPTGLIWITDQVAMSNHSAQEMLSIIRQYPDDAFGSVEGNVLTVRNWEDTFKIRVYPYVVTWTLDTASAELLAGDLEKEAEIKKAGYVVAAAVVIGSVLGYFYKKGWNSSTAAEKALGGSLSGFVTGLVGLKIAFDGNVVKDIRNCIKLAGNDGRITVMFANGRLVSCVHGDQLIQARDVYRRW